MQVKALNLLRALYGKTAMKKCMTIEWYKRHKEIKGDAKDDTKHAYQN